MKLEHPCAGLVQDANWWGKTKEMLTLDKVMESLPDVHFYWAGDGQYKDKILQAYSKHKNFHYLGTIDYPDKVREFLTEIDMYMYYLQEWTRLHYLAEKQCLWKNQLLHQMLVEYLK